MVESDCLRSCDASDDWSNDAGGDGADRRTLRGAATRSHGAATPAAAFGAGAGSAAPISGSFVRKSNSS